MATAEQPQGPHAPRHWDDTESQWRDAVAATAQRAYDFYGEAMVATIHKAKAIVLNGDVWLDPTGSGGKVRS